MQNDQILFVGEIKNAVALYSQLINVRVNEEVLLNKFGPLTIHKTNINVWSHPDNQHICPTYV
jgi:hypothetical protein